MALRVASGFVAFGIDTPHGTRWLGACASRDAVELVVTAMQAVLECVPRTRMRDLSAAALSKLQLAVMPKLQPLPPLDPARGRVIGLLDDAAGVCRAVRPARGGPAPASRRSGDDGGRARSAPVAMAHALHAGARCCGGPGAARGRAGDRVDRRRTRSAAAHRSLSRRAGLRIRHGRCPRRCTPSRAAHGRAPLRRHRPRPPAAPRAAHAPRRRISCWWARPVDTASCATARRGTRRTARSVRPTSNRCLPDANHG